MEYAYMEVRMFCTHTITNAYTLGSLSKPRLKIT